MMQSGFTNEIKIGTIVQEINEQIIKGKSAISQQL